MESEKVFSPLVSFLKYVIIKQFIIITTMYFAPRILFLSLFSLGSLLFMGESVRAEGDILEKQLMLRTREYTQFLSSLPSDRTLLSRGEALLGLFEFHGVTLDGRLDTYRTQGTLFFADVPPTDPLYGAVGTACLKKLLTCSPEKNFSAKDPIELTALLKLFYELKYEKEGPAYLVQLYKLPAREPWYAPYTIEAKKRGLIGNTRSLSTLIRSDFFYILYKASLLEGYKDLLPNYFVGLVLDRTIIHDRTYHDLSQLTQIIREYDLMLEYLERKLQDASLLDSLTIKQVMLSLSGNKSAFQSLYEQVAANPLYYQPKYPEKIKAQFAANGIKEVIGTGVYDFRTSAAYRKHNIRTSIEKLDGMVIAPGADFDFWKEMRSRGMNDLMHGWVIVGDKEEWAYGGGLCGTATTLFRSAWFAGLEILERRPHSIYYYSFYSAKEIGLDAAVYQNSPNLRFRNNTGAPLMLHVRYITDKRDVAEVEILGNKHFKSIRFEGPYREKGYYMNKRIMEMKDGTIKEDLLKSSYRKIL